MTFSGVGILAFRLSSASVSVRVSAELEPALKWTPNIQVEYPLFELSDGSGKNTPAVLEIWSLCRAGFDPWVEKGMAPHSVLPQSFTGSQEGHGVKRWLINTCIAWTTYSSNLNFTWRYHSLLGTRRGMWAFNGGGGSGWTRFHFIFNWCNFITKGWFQDQQCSIGKGLSCWEQFKRKHLGQSELWNTSELEVWSVLGYELVRRELQYWDEALTAGNHWRVSSFSIVPESNVYCTKGLSRQAHGKGDWTGWW